MLIRSEQHALITIKTALMRAERILGPAHETARIDAEVLLAYVTDRSRTWLHTWPDHQLTAEQTHRYYPLVQRRTAGEPVAYLTGSREFWSLPLHVTTATLIPRPETELLVEQALLRIPENTAHRIADLGTGCGAIALAIALERPASHIMATDIAANALDVAKHNVARLGIHNVECRQGDWFKPLAGQYFNIIVTNPPYISAGDPYIQQGDLRFEPIGALVPGIEGLEALRIIVSQARNHLLDQGWLLVEHGYKQQEDVIDLFERAGYLHIQGFTDIAGKDRLVAGQYLAHQTSPRTP